MRGDFTPVFLGSGRCFHTMDWFRSCAELVAEPPIYITDNYGRDGLAPLLKPADSVRELLIIDPVLFKKASRVGHVWRNLLKLLLVPLQIFLLRRQLRRISAPFVFAHSTYYAFLASFCHARYSATPQGSEVLVRPQRSKFYKWFLARSVRSAAFVTVDSPAMAARLMEATGVTAQIVQNGIDIASIRALLQPDSPRNLVTSMRGIEPNYRIREILAARDASAAGTALHLCFPFVEESYLRDIRRAVRSFDVLHGRLPREALYRQLGKSICAISIPISDSSPRSVYEAIFCGVAVIATSATYIDFLPVCMRARILVVDVEKAGWLGEAIEGARRIAATPYVPSAEALDSFDQSASMRKCLQFAQSHWSKEQ